MSKIVPMIENDDADCVCSMNVKEGPRMNVIRMITASFVMRWAHARASCFHLLYARRVIPRTLCDRQI